VTSRGAYLGSELHQSDLEIARDRISRVFRYLQALNEHRNPPKRLLRDQPWSMHFRRLPDHHSIQRGGPGDEILLRVRRPFLTPAPKPPAIIADWLERGWEEPDGEVRFRPSENRVEADGETIIVPFGEDPARPSAFEDWRALREEWAKNERPARDAAHIFERLYALHGTLEREGGRHELIIGDGILLWKRDEIEINHPVLFRRVQLDFKPEAKEFTIVDVGREAELYVALFQSVPGVDGRTIDQCRSELEQGDFHPLGEEDTNGFLTSLVMRLSPRGQFSAVRDEAGVASEDPWIVRDPVLFLRERSLGMSEAISKVLDEVKRRSDLPRSLLAIIGVHPMDGAICPDGPARASEPNSGVAWGHSDEILFAKPANQEQCQIAERLDRYKAVLVQGPPGTGKTHTIANLIGHLLARGESILVTSHTTKALRVLREQVVEPLRPLCVSLLEGDLQSRQELQASVQAIASKLDSNPDQLEERARSLSGERGSLSRDRRKIHDELIKARADEYRTVVVAGQNYAPSDAARVVARGIDHHDWIPGGLSAGEPLPLSPGELADLYRCAKAVTPANEQELTLFLPDPQDPANPAEFEAILAQHARVAATDRTTGTEYWTTEPAGATGEAERLDRLVVRIEEAVAKIETDRPWRLAAIEAGCQDERQRAPWDDLVRMIDTVCALSADAQVLMIRHAPKLPDNTPLPLQKSIVGGVIRHLERGRRLGLFFRLTHPAHRSWVAGASVKGRPPGDIEEFKALAVLIDLTMAREELIERWDRQMASLGAPASSDLAREHKEPERPCRQYVPEIRACLDWHADSWVPIESMLKQLGFPWERVLAESSPNLSAFGDLLRLRDAATNRLIRILAARADAIRYQAIQIEIDRRLDALINVADGPPSRVVIEMSRAIEARDATAYRTHFQRFNELWLSRRGLTRRDDLLARLERTAPAWAAAIRNRQALHIDGQVPGDADAEAAWLWRQFHEELERRAEKSLERMQRSLEALDGEIRRVTAELIEQRAWAAQVRRVTPSQRQTLQGWLALMLKTRKGGGRLVPEWLSAARKLMASCRPAVPVWIMPLSRVAENFDPATTRFDVLIIDEASQSDVFALIALSMARKVVVVGDHEQVSPSAVGHDVKEILDLINAHLDGVPNKLLYDLRTSVYDLARTAFGGTILLTEHFRCVSDIIAFSNDLSYKGRIKPLRDATRVETRPHVIAYRVEARPADGDINRDEAIHVAALLIAASEHQAYNGKTFGVISLLGDQQALEIERLLRSKMEHAEYARRRILCGSAAQFQGDERDVMFLSVVHTPQDGPLRMRDDDDTKRRFNVAASRARDQMWVVHSLDPKTDLKPGDLRRRLIEHAEDPGAIARQIVSISQRVESEFERLVGERLTRAGYRVHPQWKVGAYRIDLVVEGTSERRLAIECDGDRYHHTDEQLQADLERQALLERLGWTFARIRGSQFFRDPDAALAPVFERLQRLGIEPSGPDVGSLDVTIHEQKESVVRRAFELLAKWSDEEANEPDESGEDMETDTPAMVIRTGSNGQDGSSEEIIAVLRSAETSLGKSAILERADIPKSGWERTIRLLKKHGIVEQIGERGRATYRLVTGHLTADRDSTNSVISDGRSPNAL
jgi:very-short-patch-repair endonuclease